MMQRIAIFIVSKSKKEAPLTTLGRPFALDPQIPAPEIAFFCRGFIEYPPKVVRCFRTYWDVDSVDIG